MDEPRRRREGAARAAAASARFVRAGATFRVARGTGPLAWLRAQMVREIEQRRLFPWIAVAYGLGIALAFAADGPLELWPPLGLGLALGAAAFLSRARLGRLAVLIGLSALLLGFASAAIRIETSRAPVLDRMAVSRVEGFVESVEERQAGGRLVIRVAKQDKVGEGASPTRVRVTTRALAGAAPGDYVRATARLLPPPEAARPGGYDFARDAYFRGIGAVGSLSGRLEIVAPPPVAPDLALRWAALVDRARNALTSRIAGAIGGQAGAVAAALITGKRGLIDDHSNDILRAAGIYHIVSISGLHMVLAAGVFFWLTRAMLALSPALALGWPIKKIAAFAGMVAATGYCVFSGSDVATERSLFMILVMQGAILVDRPALSLRNLAISALIVLTREPETLLGPSLQMSYAAVAGLIALAEWNRGRRRPAEGADLLRRSALWLGAILFGTVATTIVATIATGPFSTFHFQNLQPYGIIGNAATLPLVSFVVMPCAVIGTLLYGFGLDRPVWWVMGQGVSAVLKLSEWVAAISGSVVIVPAFGATALVLFVLAILCATLFVSGLRWLALAPLALGGLAAWGTVRPDLYVARDGSGLALRTGSGSLSVVGRVAPFTAEQWLRADGDARRAKDPSVTSAARCDRLGCTATMTDGRAVAMVQDRRAFAEDCRRAAIVVSRLVAPSRCGAALVLDGRFLATNGAVTVTLAGKEFALETSRRPDGGHPWLARSPLSASRAGPAAIAGGRRETGPGRPGASAVPPPSTDEEGDAPSVEPRDDAEP